MDGFVLATTTAPDRETAMRVARALVERRLAACVNLVPKIESHYWWQGKLESGAEVLLLIKTTGKQFAGVRQTIQEINTYELPEILAYRVDEASDAFASWIAKTTMNAGRKKVPARRKASRRAAAGSAHARFGDSVLPVGVSQPRHRALTAGGKRTCRIRLSSLSSPHRTCTR